MEKGLGSCVLDLPYRSSEWTTLTFVSLGYRDLREYLFALSAYDIPIGDGEVDAFDFFNDGSGYAMLLGMLAAYALNEPYRNNPECHFVLDFGNVVLREDWYLATPGYVLDAAQVAKRCVLPAPLRESDLVAYGDRYGYDSRLDAEDIEHMQSCVDDFNRLRGFYLRHAAAGRGMILRWA